MQKLLVASAILMFTMSAAVAQTSNGQKQDPGENPGMVSPGSDSGSSPAATGSKQMSGQNMTPKKENPGMKTPTQTHKQDPGENPNQTSPGSS